MRSNRRPLTRLGPILVAGALALSACAGSSAEQDVEPAAEEGPASAERGEAGGYEVWAIDQSDTAGLEYGGALHIYDGETLAADPTAAEPEVVDLAGAVSEQCMSDTGANPVRPHIVAFNADDSHAIISFVATGHVAFLDAESRDPVKCFRMSEGFEDSIQAHAAFPAPDDSYVVVANQAGKLLERIDTDANGNGTPYENADDLVHDTAATLDLANCTTPNEVACEAPDLRPNNTVICPNVDSSSRYTFITLGGGGMFVADTSEGGAPPPIVAEYDTSAVGAHGCGGMQTGVETGDLFYINSGAGPTHPSSAALYSFALDELPQGPEFNPPGVPAPNVLFDRHDDGHDSHGMVVNEQGDGRYLWVADRAANEVEVIDTVADERVDTFTLEGEASTDPAPDLADVAPDGSHIFLSLRGPCPLTANVEEVNNAVGATPGVGVVEVRDDGATGELIGVAPMNNIDADGANCAPDGAPESDDRSDPHGIAVRTLG